MLSGKVLKANGWPEGKIIGYAKAVASALEAQGLDQPDVLSRLAEVRADPASFLEDKLLGTLARECQRRARAAAEPPADELRDQPLEYRVWGEDQIDASALSQMRNALRLPVAVAGALMPDAHVGYGLPIGGVLATKDAVIPYAVGVDIGCRMRLSVYEVAPGVLDERREAFQKALLERTRFGMGASWSKSDLPTHEVLDDSAWSELRLLKSLQAKAQVQLGTSGTGNHFVEWGTFRLYSDDKALDLPAGEYLALLSHSGSRAVGAKIAENYTGIAMSIHPALDKSMRHLAWLPLESEAGQEYWLAMELAGRFASANHAVIHSQVARAAGISEIASVENFHNFAWRETLADGSQAIVHRKGATPAGAGVLGVIPGSMGDAGYVVRGKGDPEALLSAAHGAGRKMSRTAAINSISKTARDTYLKARNVTLLGGSVDESPQAYKDIEGVIEAQSDLVEIIGIFTPRIVRMAEEAGEF